jgi:hypothetical protein
MVAGENPPVNPMGGEVYEIQLACELDARWAEWFDQLAVIAQPNGETILRGPIVDQAQLHGVLMRIRDLGLKLVSVNRVIESRTVSSPASSDPDVLTYL